MFPNANARLQVKKEADECSIDICVLSCPLRTFTLQHAGYTDSRHWDAMQRTPEVPHQCGTVRDVNKDGGTQQLLVSGAMPLKFLGRGSLEAYPAQFELLATAAGWTGRIKAVQLALSLTEDAAACLLLLTPGKREDYAMLVGALQRCFGVLNLNACRGVKLFSSFHHTAWFL